MLIILIERAKSGAHLIILSFPKHIQKMICSLIVLFDSIILCYLIYDFNLTYSLVIAVDLADRNSDKFNITQYNTINNNNED